MSVAPRSRQRPDVVRRRPRALAGLLAVVALALLPLAPGPSRAAGGPTTTEEPEIEGKTFAAYEFGWYPIEFVDHFVERLSRRWEVEGEGTVRTQNGMLTVMSSGDGSIGTTLRGQSHTEGRWEIRLRARRYERSGTDFTVAAELIPSDGVEDCGAREIAFASFRPTGRQVRLHARTLPDRSFETRLRDMVLPDDYWHTYGVEVTPRRISWFVDGVVRATERRPEALSGVPFDLRLQLRATPDATMNDSRLQVDTVRYFTLKSPNDLPVRAPRPVQRTYADACPAS